MNDDPLLPEEQDRLARARIPVAPPPGAEDRLVGALRERGLLRRRASSAIGWIAAAASVVLIAAAWMLWPRTVPSGPRFILLLYAGSDPIQGTAADRRREYADWARTVASRGVAISGEELTGESRTLGATSSSTEADPRGFFLISAPDMEAAQQIALTCPHLRYGGRVRILRVAGS